MTELSPTARCGHHHHRLRVRLPLGRPGQGDVQGPRAARRRPLGRRCQRGGPPGHPRRGLPPPPRPSCSAANGLIAEPRMLSCNRLTAVVRVYIRVKRIYTGRAPTANGHVGLAEGAAARGRCGVESPGHPPRRRRIETCGVVRFRRRPRQRPWRDTRRQ